MQFTIENPKAKAVIEELSNRLTVKPEVIVNAALNELVRQYVSKPTLATHVVKMALRREGVEC